ncbi:MAG TPA: vancomycin resistance protein [Oceanithermus profundus]|uniref:Vancomycin resistance protein n=1 Tax=Oceanithermus profundus TaxID=187137 RepID=A0A7C4ZEU4_9DEIN|nr:vancomycin resistance protein [Oceanithermus profundus]
MREFWKVLGLLLIVHAAAAQVNAVWVIRDYEIVDGELRGYVGTKTYPVNSLEEVRALSDLVRREVKPARWVLDPERGWVALQRRGYRMDVEAAVVAYRDAAFLGRTQFVIPVEVIEPEPSVLEWYARGVRELIGEGVTNFWGSSRARIHNIRTGAARLNGAWIPRGAEFSFNQAVGAIDEDHGYVESLVIVGDATEKGVGGGICQVSTTTFRAAFFAGLPITERHPHSYQLRYYRPLGLDATIYQPWRDLKFTNDTPGDILVQAQVRGYKLYVRFFGTADRSVEWEGPFISDRKPALAPREVVDESLEPGYREQVDWAAAGLTARVTRKVYYQDGRVYEDEFKSVYRPWGDVFLVGPPPPPELEPTVPLPPVIGVPAAQGSTRPAQP